MKAKIVFFDADGTLWNFNNENTTLRSLKDASLDKEVLSLLKILKENKVKCVVVSYQPYRNNNYSKNKLRKWLDHFKINDYFSQVYIADKVSYTKDKIIRNILGEEKITRKEALFIGDRYKWDYQPAKKAGIKAFLLDKPENSKYKVKKYSFKQIEKVLE